MREAEAALVLAKAKRNHEELAQKAKRIRQAIEAAGSHEISSSSKTRSGRGVSAERKVTHRDKTDTMKIDKITNG